MQVKSNQLNLLFIFFCEHWVFYWQVNNYIREHWNSSRNLHLILFHWSRCFVMLASQQQSLSLYGRSPPGSFLAEYSVPPAPIARPAPVLRGRSAPSLPVQHIFKNAPPRPCLAHRPAVPRAKKRVVFADDQGLALTQVRIMSEPSHVPPCWALRLVAAASGNQTTQNGEKRPPQDKWETRFAQPASDYIEFRRRITEDNVSLENVIVKDKEGCLDGTVKVKNLDFHKEVFVRSTADGWRTHEDTTCAFSDSGPVHSCPQNVPFSTYDTFSFKLQLPVHSRRLEFCVAFRCKGVEYWDSNGNINYCIEKRSVRSASSAYCSGVLSGNSWNIRSDGNTPYWWMQINPIPKCLRIAFVVWK